ncbi:MAG: hypothetical protein K6A23_08550 [Butyrivibrio sp.]|nr:hypothetical protein [Butyrivibrio sp.]
MNIINQTVKRITVLFLLSTFIPALLSGCGKDTTELDTYKSNMEVFFTTISNLNTSINSIDATSEDASSELLGYLDQMNEAFQQMASYEIPEEFSSIESLATESAEYMEKAVSTYHEAYDGEFDENSENLAGQYYERANNRVQYMIQIFHGEVPSGEGVSVTTEDTYHLESIDPNAESSESDN